MKRTITIGVVGLALLAGACSGKNTSSKNAAATTTSTEAALIGSLPKEGALANVIKISGSKAARGDIPKSGITTDDKAVRTNNVHTMEDFMVAIINDVNSYWRNAFNQSGIGQYFRAPQYNWYQSGTIPANACGVTSDIGAYYCSNDSTIYFSPQLAYDKWTGAYVAGGRKSARPGDFSVATTIGHEFGHHIQSLLSISKPNPGFELQADCLSGGWANSAYYENILEPGDIEEGVASRDQVGDTNFGDPDHHGTGPERVASFLNGYNNTIGACFS